MVGQKLIEEEKAESGEVKWSVYKDYLRSIGYVNSVVTLFFFAAYQGFQLGE